MRELVDAFYRERSLANHHIMSYNDFSNYWLQDIIDKIKVGDDEAERGTITTDIEGYEVKLGKIRIGNPLVKEADGSTRLLTPMEARLRNLTYEAPMYLEFIPIIEGVEHEPEEVRIGDMPIMVKSAKCNITKENLERHEGTIFTPEEYYRRLMELQEDPLDIGGYFIINGTERVLISLEDLAPNRVMVEFNKRYGRDVPVAKVFSQREGYRALVIVEMKKDATLMVSVPAASGQLPLVVLLRALGMESDEDVMNAIVTDPEMMPFVLSNIEDSVNEYGVSNREEAVAFLGKKLAGGQAKEYRIKRVESLMDRSLLPHLGNDPDDRMKKAIFLGRMARSVLELAIGHAEPDDKDHYANKRLKLAGDLMEDLFRVAFTGLVKDLKYQLERAHSRNRELKVSTAVRSDVLSQRLLHALATGNWVGGRAGVSQLLDRTSNLATLSHLRRIISPLTRSQPHFEARDLHATQWGRLCPAETPEGPNCGLVKNMALMTEISEGYDDKEVLQTVRDLGVQEIHSKDIELGV
ncbi:MAG TPA: DNA-directed RNA polymerase subunit B'' [Candidatus Thermoplasmatota archaeon]|nr:DNA-directed RNA polymerase subunit B'' [Candidatus Thermoplasmatota archaeon]